MSDFLLVLLGSGVTAVGFVIQRAITKAGVHEDVDLKSRMLDLRAKMASQGVSFSQLDEFQQEMLTKRAAQRKVEDDVLVELAEHELASSAEIEVRVRKQLGTFDSTEMTQGEMNAAQGDELSRAEEVMNDALQKLRGLISAPEAAFLSRSQTAWIRYRDQQGDFAASRYEGGSIQPLIRFGEMTELTVERIVRLRLEIDHIEFLNR